MFQEESETINVLSNSTSEAVPLLNPPNSPGRLAKSVGAPFPPKNVLKRETAKVIERKRRKEGGRKSSIGSILDDAPKVKIDWLQNFEIKTAGDEEPIPSLPQFLECFEGNKKEFEKAYLMDLKTTKHSWLEFSQVMDLAKEIAPEIKNWHEHAKATYDGGSHSGTDGDVPHKDAPIPVPFPKLGEAMSHPSGISFLHKEKEPIRYWLHVPSPTPDQLSKLQEIFHIHPLTSEDIITPSTREKIEEYRTYLYVVYNERQQVPDSNHHRDVNVNLLLFHNFILSITPINVNALIPVIYHVQYQLPLNAPVDWIIYKYLDVITDEYILTVDNIFREVEFIDSMVGGEIGEGNKEEILRRIGVSRHQLTKLRGSLLSKREILSILCSSVRTCLFIEPKTKVYLRDVMDHIVLMIQRLEMANEMLSNTSNTHLALISIEIATTDHKMNESVKCFGAVATIILPMTVITGLWGMNVSVPGQEDAPFAAWFYGIVGIFLFWGILATVVFRKKGWF